MKKKINLFYTFIIFASLSAISVKAQTVNVSDESSLKTCLTANGNTCVLDADIKLKEDISISDSVILDLNGKKIERDASMTGKSSLLNVRNGATLTINDDTNKGLISGGNTKDVFGAIRLTLKDDDASKTAKLIINGGHISAYYYAIVGNGTRNNTYVEINGGIIEGLNNEDSLGIFNPQVGKIVVNGGEIKGGTGIEMRSGELVVNGGVITSTSNKLEAKSNGNGSSTIGAGIAVAQHTTGNAINVTINGGTISGIVPLYQINIEEKTLEDVNKIKIVVNDGIFKTINDGIKSLDIENEVFSILGGTYNIEPEEEYVKEPFEVVKEKGLSIVKLKSTNDITPVDPSQEVKDVTIGVSEESIDIISNSLATELKNNAELLGLVKDKKLVISFVYSEIEKIGEDSKKVLDEELKKLGATNAGYFDIGFNILNERNKEEVLGRLTSLDEAIELQFAIPEKLVNNSKEYTRVFYVIRMHDGKAEIIDTTVSEDGKVLTALSDKFSTYELVYKDVKIEKEEEPKNPKTVDNITIFTMVGFISLGACGLYINLLNKKRCNN